MPILDSSKRLKKDLSLFGVYTLATGATLSSGFFLLPGLAAREAGPAVVMIYMFALILLLPGILSKVELATAMPRAGGVYYFVDRSLGPLAGTIGGLGTWASLILKTAFAMIGISAYMGIFFPNIPIVPVAVGLTLALGVLNLFGARKSSAVQAVLVIGLLALLVWFTFVGVPAADLSHFDHFWGHGTNHLLASTGLVCVSYMGMTKVASVAEEIKNPERNLPLGIFLAMGTAVLVYGLGTYVIVGTVPAAELYGGDEPTLTPVADAAENIIGHWGAVLMTVAAVLAFLSVGNAGILSASRYPLAMSRDHLLPAWLGKLNKWRTPANAVILTAGGVTLVLVVFNPMKIAELASTFLLMMFALNCLSVIVMRECQLDSYDPSYRSPLYPWLHIFGILGPLVVIIKMGLLASVFMLGLIFVGTLWYMYYARHRVVRGGAINHLFARWGSARFEGLDRELRSILKEKGLRAADPYDDVIAKSIVIDEQNDSSFELVVNKASQQLALRLPMTADQLAKNFMDGTRVGATPVSKGVALPHIRLPDMEHPLMVLARVPDGVHVEVDAAYARPVGDQAIHAVIFLISPEEDAAQHLRILAQVAQHVDSPAFMGQWLAASSDLEIQQTLFRTGYHGSINLLPDGPAAELIGTTLDQLTLPHKCQVSLIHRQGQTLQPQGSTALEANDQLTIVGDPDGIEQLAQQYPDATDTFVLAGDGL